MSAIVGRGDFRYRIADDWAKLSDGWQFGDVAGNFRHSWGEGIFRRAHGVHMGPVETIYLTDDGDHTVRKCSLEGKLLLTIGIPDAPAPFMSGEPFCRCTHTALSPNNEIYVSDGHGCRLI